jgi:hypothetical protein
MEGKQESSFLKKRSKKLLHSGYSLSREAAARQIKVFCFFFSKKKSFPSLAHGTRGDI